MDIMRIGVSFIIVLGSLHLVSAGCAQNIVSDPSFTQCLMGYSQYMTSATEAASPDSSDIMASMCSPEGKAAMKCMLDFIKSCPDLLSSPDSGSMMVAFKQFENIGGIDSYCNTIAGPCQAVLQCISSQSMNGSSMMNYPTPLNAFQDSIRAMCGPVKGLFDCFKDVGDQCKQVLEQVKTNYFDTAGKDVPAGITVPTFEQSKMFVQNECPRIPSDFGTNSCVKDQLMSREYLDCFGAVAQKYGTINCDAYKEGHECVKKTVGNRCGAAYLNAFVKISPMFLTGLPENCKVAMEDTNNSNLLHMSVVSIIVALALAFHLN